MKVELSLVEREVRRVLEVLGDKNIPSVSNSLVLQRRLDRWEEHDRVKFWAVIAQVVAEEFG